VKPSFPFVTFACSLAILFAAVIAPPAIAFDIQGKIINGTTGAKDIDADVIIVNPSGGMAQEKTVRASGGTFTVTDLKDDAPIYLVRVEYQGIAYNEMVRPEGQDMVEVLVMIYEATTSWEGIRVSIPHLVVAREDDHIEVEQLFEINNVSNPARAISGDEVAFHYRVPEDMIEVTGLYVSALGMPLQRSPEPTDDPGIYKVSYPIRPGITRVGLSYTVPYNNETWTYGGKLLYDVEELVVFNVDPDMKIEGNVTLDVSEAAHDMMALTATSIPEGTDLAITFTGGSGLSTAPTNTSGAVLVLPNRMEGVSLMIMLIILMALLACMGLAVSGGPSPLDDKAQVRMYYELLLKRLARLDDLRKADAIPSDVYRAQREELKQALSSLVQRLREIESGTQTSHAATPGEAPSPPSGEEQRNAS